MTAAIELTDLQKTFATRGLRKKAMVAINSVSLSVAEGEAFGFIGPNGAGKSTAIKILTGVLRATAGTASIFGVPVNQPMARRGLGYVPENPYLSDYLTPSEILTMSLRMHKVVIQDEKRHCRNWLERFQLEEVADKSIRSFSKGMTQRVALAQALCIQPRLLILDEPLSGLDPIGRRDVVDILSDFRRAGGTLFFSSHVLYDVERLADRYGLIHKGILRAVRSPSELVGGDEKVVVRSNGTQVVPGLIPETPGRWYVEVPRATLWDKLEQLKCAGHLIHEVKPTLSLETAFLHAVRDESV